MGDKKNDHGLKAILATYWRAYGGWKAVFRSPYFWLSIALLAVTWHYWASQPWWEQVLSVIPNLLGFTLGGFAVFLGFGDEKFKSLIAGEDSDLPGETSPYMEMCSAFLHFVIVQCLALIVGIVAKATAFEMTGCLKPVTQWIENYRWIADMFGYWVFLYGICLALAAAIGIFRVAFWFDSYQTANRDSGS